MVKKTFFGALKVFLYLCMFFVISIISYKVTLYLDSEAIGKHKKISSIETIVKANVDEVAKNLVLGVDQDTSAIKSIVLEVFNINTKNIDLITIPETTKVTVSQELYEKLIKVNSHMPQIITLSEIGNYFEQAVAYEYLTLILNEYLDTTISFYSAMLTQQFDEYFTAKTTDNGAYTFCQEKLEEFKGYTTEEKVTDALMSYYEGIQSNLKLSERKTYVTYYLRANLSNIRTYRLEETHENETYQLSSEQKERLRSIFEGAGTYNVTDNTSEEGTKSSKEVSIQILNSTTVTGLAATYKTKLMELGYQVDAVGNYATATLEDTKIVVNEYGLGSDLKQYFDNPTIEFGTVDGGYDILIILGSKDA